MRYRRVLPVVVALVALACSGGSEEPAADGVENGQPPEQASLGVAAGAEASPGPEAKAATGQGGTGTAGVPRRTPTPTPHPDCFVQGSIWKTNFCKHSVPLDEIISGGPPRDGITPVDNPKFVAVDPPPEYMKADDPVISLEIDGEARAYPLAILIKQEIVNDQVGGVPVTVTYCPLCNSAIVFDRRVNGTVLDFGTTGLLRHSDLIMWDRETQSWWQQITGEAIVGELTGSRLEFVPAQIVSWADFKQAFPQGLLLSRDLGLGRTYDSPPYIGYELRESPGLFLGDPDPRLPVKERVAGVTIGEESVAYPFALLAEQPVINDSIGGKDVVVFYSGGTLSAFTPGITPDFSRLPNIVVGSTGVFEPVVEGRKLTFVADGDEFMDRETGSRWNILGQAVEGPLTGSQLTPIVHGNHFWFAWAAFHPDTEVRTAEDVS